MPAGVVCNGLQSVVVTHCRFNPPPAQDSPRPTWLCADAARKESEAVSTSLLLLVVANQQMWMNASKC